MFFKRVNTRLLGLSIMLLQVVQVFFVKDIDLTNTSILFEFSTDALVFLIIGYWLMFDKYKKFILLHPIAVFSSIYFGFVNKGVLNQSDLINVINLSLILYATIITFDKWTIRKTIASFFITSVFILTPGLLSLRNAILYNSELFTTYITYSIALMSFSIVYIIISRYLFFITSNKNTEINYWEDIAKEARFLIGSKKEITNIVLKEYSEKHVNKYEKQINVDDNLLIEVPVTTTEKSFTVIEKVEANNNFELENIIVPRAPSL